MNKFKRSLLRTLLGQEQYDFLVDLGNELVTQDNHGTASPLLFVIEETEKLHGVDPDYYNTCRYFYFSTYNVVIYEESQSLRDDLLDLIFRLSETGTTRPFKSLTKETMKDIESYVRTSNLQALEEYEDTIFKYEEELRYNYRDSMEEDTLYPLLEMIADPSSGDGDLMDAALDFFETVTSIKEAYETEVKKYSNGFLTHKAAEHHMSINGHNYKQARIYATHAFRNVELEYLTSIAKSFATVRPDATASKR